MTRDERRGIVAAVLLIAFGVGALIYRSLTPTLVALPVEPQPDDAPAGS